MASELRFDGRVVLVTGAGGGLGKQYALDFARRGASVVVNDLGGDIRGDGKASRPADKVVEEIRAKGGKAVANYDSVENGEKLVQTALSNFGRIDVVINNAGILRDKSFARISDEDWDIIHRVHLRGSFQVSRAAWPHMKKQKYGRIIMTTSDAGIYGNFGQANYAAAKLGLLGLGNTLSIEGRKDNIFCNTIAPTAGSRLTATVMPADVVDALKPEYVMPLVVYLCHESCTENGGVFEVGGGWMAKMQWQRAPGAVVRQKGSVMTAEAVRDKWDSITDFTDATNPKTIQEAMTKVYQTIQEIESSSPGPQMIKTAGTRNSKIKPELARNFKMGPMSFTYTEKDIILYALGIGASTSEPDYLNFLYEGSDELSVIPSFAVIPAFKILTMIGQAPGLEFDPTKVLHGEQYVELYRKFPTSGTLTTTARIVDVLDKGSGCLIICNTETYNEKKEKVAFNQFTTFVVGSGNFGGARSSVEAKTTVEPPSRKPDMSVQEKTSIDQAALYRLSGDTNPLHIDPSFAAMGGFQTPILHGLCSFGYATRHVLKNYADNDVSKIRAIKGRFTKPVLPGQTIQTDMWKEGQRIHFQCRVVENENVCLTGAYVDLIPSLYAEKQISEADSGLKSDLLFEEMKKQIHTRPDLVKKIHAIFQYNITKGGKQVAQWTVDMKSGGGEIYQGEPKNVKAECTLTIADEDLLDLATGKLNAQKAYFSGKLKLKGNIMLAQKLGQMFQEQAKL